MKAAKLPAPANNLRRVRRGFEGWRRTCKGFSSIPETLWSSAVAIAREQGLHKTTRALPEDKNDSYPLQFLLGSC